MQAAKMQVARYKLDAQHIGTGLKQTNTQT